MINVGGATAGPFQGCEGSGGFSAGGDNVTHRVEGGISEVCQ